MPEAGEPDSAAVVTWPSRDIGGVKTLPCHGFAPLAVIAARPAGRCPGGPPPATGVSRQRDHSQSDVSLRRAEAADIDALVSLGLGVIRFDAHVSGVSERPGTTAALRRELSELLTAPEPWIWLAERSGTAVGMLAAERPETARWIAPLVGVAPVAYLSC